MNMPTVGSESVALSFGTLLNRTAKNWVKLCVFGDAYTGKTLMAGRLAMAGYNVLYIDLDNAGVTLANDSFLTDEAKGRITLIPINDIAGVATLTATLFDDKKTKNICVEHSKYNCQSCNMGKKQLIPLKLADFSADSTIVVIDSGKALTDAVIELARGDRPPNYKFQLDDWGFVRNYLSTFLRQMKTYPMHTIVLTGVDYTATEANPLSKNYPALGSSRTSGEMILYFTDTVLARVDKGQYSYVCLPAQASGYAVGSRTAVDLTKSTVPKDNPLTAFFKPLTK